MGQNGWETSEISHTDVFPVTGKTSPARQEDRGAWLSRAARVPCTVLARGGAWELQKKFLKIPRRPWRRVGRVGVFTCHFWSYVREVISVLARRCLNNVFLVISHIGETYSEDERSQARRGGYDPATYQWVGSFFVKPIYILWFFPESAFKWNVRFYRHAYDLELMHTCSYIYFMHMLVLRTQR